MKRAILSMIVASCSLVSRGGEVLFQENFAGGLTNGWSWLRENQPAWRVRPGALEIRIEPGNMWGPANDAKNVLVRSLPASRPLELSVTVSNRPTEQYEQVDLVCYYDDSHMVKIGFELVDGQRSIVMGREEKDRTRTIAIRGVEASIVDLRLVIQDDLIRGFYRDSDLNGWHEAGSCEPPSRGTAKLSIQCYQGPANVERWAAISNVRVRVPDR